MGLKAEPVEHIDKSVYGCIRTRRDNQMAEMWMSQGCSGCLDGVEVIVPHTSPNVWWGLNSYVPTASGVLLKSECARDHGTLGAGGI